jgi:hypothetical protein
LRAVLYVCLAAHASDSSIPFLLYGVLALTYALESWARE